MNSQQENNTIQAPVITAAALSEHIERVLAGLNMAEAVYRERNEWEFPERARWIAKPKSKYINLDTDGSGAFMVEIATGELFNIQGYGKPDKNKKRKANLGNIATVDPAWLHTKRYNYLR